MHAHTSGCMHKHVGLHAHFGLYACRHSGLRAHGVRLSGARSVLILQAPFTLGSDLPRSTARSDHWRTHHTNDARSFFAHPPTSLSVSPLARQPAPQMCSDAARPHRPRACRRRQCPTACSATRPVVDFKLH
eukprot:296277-Chlamydomonas_euryale.AAC.1